MAFQWTYYSWDEKRHRIALRADAVLQIKPAPRQHPISLESLVAYADSAYLSCRVLVLSSRLLHHEALYCAAQALEKYMKALLHQKGEPVRPYGHNLVKLATALGDSFLDPEFVKVCERLAPFEQAGRYPDHALQSWGYPITLLAFLDMFVAHCRDLLSLPAGTRNIIADLLEQNPNGNPVMTAAITAVRDQNHYLSELVGL